MRRGAGNSQKSDSRQPRFYLPCACKAQASPMLEQASLMLAQASLMLPQASLMLHKLI